MAINKIDRVVLHEDVKQDLDNKATKQELQNAKQELENNINEIYQGIVWKSTVSTFDDLRKEYPDAKDGWKSTTMDTNITYQYDLETDTWFATSINALPLATSEIDGLMAKEDKSKLDTVQLNAQKNLTPQQTLEQIKTVDGHGSGLDADLFQGKTPNNFADKIHNHDGKYNTKTEITTLLNGKAKKNHVHSKEQITDFEHTHSPSEIIENESKRFVSDTEKDDWNDANNKKHTHENKSIIDAITQTLIDKWNSAWEHISDTVKHITATERANWNNKAETSQIPAKVGELENDKNYVTSTELGSAGYGDMTKGVYDKNGDGTIDKAEIANNVKWSGVTEKPSTFKPSNHKHDEYVKKTGDTIAGNDLYMDGGSVNYIRPETTGGWARGFLWSKRDRSRIGGIGMLGSEDSVSKFYIGYGISPWVNSILEVFPEYINVNGDIRKQGKSVVTVEELNTKVDKVEGKQLSTEDFTTAEKSKLSQLENDVTPYHKGTTPPSNVNLFWLDTNI